MNTTRTAISAPLIAYIRVSTQQQGKSGLGIEAQRAAIIRFAETEGLELIGEHVEVETGKGADALDRRPVLREESAGQQRLGLSFLVPHPFATEQRESFFELIGGIFRALLLQEDHRELEPAFSHRPVRF